MCITSRLPERAHQTMNIIYEVLYYTQAAKMATNTHVAGTDDNACRHHTFMLHSVLGGLYILNTPAKPATAPPTHAPFCCQPKRRNH